MQINLRIANEGTKKTICTCIFLSIVCIASFALSSSSSIKSAENFNLPDIYDGSKSYSLSDFRGKPVLLNIWASWCLNCKKEMSQLIEIQKEYDQSEFSIIAVNIDNHKDKALKFLNKLEKKTGRKLNYLVLYDGEKAVPKAYYPLGIPATYLIDEKGILKKNYFGSFSKSGLLQLESDISDMVGKAK